MGKFCMNCRKLMEKPELSHCSEECLFEDLKDTKSLKEAVKGAEFWNEKTDLWK